MVSHRGHCCSLRNVSHAGLWPRMYDYMRVRYILRSFPCPARPPPRAPRTDGIPDPARWARTASSTQQPIQSRAWEGGWEGGEGVRCGLDMRAPAGSYGL